jgi:hypothetical protein
MPSSSRPSRERLAPRGGNEALRGAAPRHSRQRPPRAETLPRDHAGDGPQRCRRARAVVPHRHDQCHSFFFFFEAASRDVERRRGP